MKKVKNVAKKLQSAQQKIKSLESKVKKVATIAEHPVRSLGGTIGAKLGSRKVGEGVGSFLGRFTGTGDYMVHGNTLARSGRVVEGTPIPAFTAVGRGIRVTHREYLGDVTASAVAGQFSISNYSVNPGLFTTFPWLSAFANQFDEWVPNGIVAIYNPLSSFYSGTTSLGTVIIASDYDVNDDAYTSKVEMENSEFAVSGSTAVALMHPIECAAGERPLKVLYTRSGAVPDGDLRFHDLCNLQVATQGCTANQVCGELWISFDITFYKTQLYGSILGKSLLFGEYFLNSSATTPFTNMGSGVNNTITSITGAGLVLTFGESIAGGSWIVDIFLINGTGAVMAAATTPTAAGGLVVKASDSLGNSLFSPADAGTGYSSFSSVIVQQKASPGVPSTLTYPTFPFANGSVRFMRIIQINPSIYT
jgi:hypothetical protein